MKDSRSETQKSESPKPTPIGGKSDLESEIPLPKADIPTLKSVVSPLGSVI